jgi:hypothetical protein
MALFIEAIIISFIFTIFLQKYYYKSSFFKSLKKNHQKQRATNGIFKLSPTKLIFAFILILLEYKLFNIFYYKYTGTYHLPPPGFQQDPNNFLWIVDMIFLLLPYPLACFAINLLGSSRKNAGKKKI